MMGVWFRWLQNLTTTDVVHRDRRKQRTFWKTQGRQRAQRTETTFGLRRECRVQSGPTVEAQQHELGMNGGTLMINR